MLPLRATAVALLALVATGAFAQAPAPLVVENNADNATTALPIIRNNQVEGFLLIEGDAGARSSLDRILGRNNINPGVGAGLALPLDNGRRVAASLSLESNPTLGLLCNGTSVSRSFGALAQHCMVANLTPNPAAPLALAQPGLRAEAKLEGERSSLSANLGLNRYDLDAPVPLPGTTVLGANQGDLMLSLNGTEVEQEDIGLLGELKLGQSGWVSIGGTLARARIVSANQLPGGLPPEWNAGSLSVGAGHGNFGGEIVGRVIEIPGSTVRYSNVGVGVTWRAPWRARLSVGAENLLSNGRNPFAPSSDDEQDESSRVPYIRYEQDL